MKVACSLFLTAGFSVATLPALAIVIDSFAPAEHDRFANNAAFIAASYDLSGVALAQNGTWLTMLSSNVFISAHHFSPGPSQSVIFYAGNDPAGPSVTRNVQSTMRISSSDLRVGVLDAPLPTGYSFFDFATDDTTNNETGPDADAESFVNSPYYLADALVFGRSPSSRAVSQDMAVGRNKLDRWFNEVSGSNDAIGAHVDSVGDPNYISSEADLRVGDSGGPMFVDEGGTLTLVGINWFISNPSGTFIGASYVGNYDAEIRAFIDLHEVDGIPEPDTIALIVVCGCAGLSFRRKRSAPLCRP